MEKLELKKSLLMDVIGIYSLQQFINLFEDDEEEKKIYEDELKILSEKLIEKGLSSETIQTIREKAMENFEYADAYLYDIITSCNIRVVK